MEQQRITGATRLVALLGDPVAHSLSPQIHNHAFARLGLDLAYVPLRVPAAQAVQTVAALRACGFVGANVTIPHKQRIIHCCDKLTPLAATIGAVNTLYFEDGLLCGTTTDPEGFLAAAGAMDEDCRGTHCVILGNGGTARTVGMTLALERRPASLTLVGRKPERVVPLAEEISRITGFEVGCTLFDSPELKAVLARCGLLINCTSVGMHPRADVSPLPADALHAGMSVFDAIYNPSETKLLRMARERGCRVQNGLRMLLYQGLASFRLWTGRVVSEDIFDLDELQRCIAGGSD